MDAKTKKYLIIGGVATVVVALAGFGVHKFIKNRKNRTTSCLLYTSPSPRDRQKSRMPSSA